MQYLVSKCAEFNLLKFYVYCRGGTLLSFFITFKVMDHFRPGNVAVRDAALI